MLALLAWLLYAYAMNTAFESFGPPKQPGPLFAYEVDGRVERLENAVKQVISQDGLVHKLANGNKVELHYVSLVDKDDTIEYEFFMEDCQSFYLLAKYKDNWNCSSSHLQVLTVSANGEPAVAHTDKKLDQSQLKAYRKIFEDQFFNRVKAGLQRQPVYEWKLTESAVKDTSYIFIDIYPRSDTGNLATRHVFANVVNFAGDTVFKQIRTERYFGDTAVFYRYDSNGVYLDAREVFVNGGFIRQDY